MPENPGLSNLGMNGIPERSRLWPSRWPGRPAYLAERPDSLELAPNNSSRREGVDLAPKREQRIDLIWSIFQG